ncbi:hypothetical protein ACFYVL_12155 [Streptomyces sp. NPDC004111]|uniref:hypothetical protein n=1 Tax=Streptomyces sp. NPDC004111 TaxID=3364690 RepID=UPI0036D07D28
MRVRGFRAAGGLTAGAGFALLAGCSSYGEMDYVNDYASHEPLRAVGYPSTGSLEMVQRVVWRLADGDVEGLAALAAEDLPVEGGSTDFADMARKTARNWVDTFGEAARGDVTADFYGEGSVRQSVILYFGKSGRTKEISVRIGSAQKWGVNLTEPDPEEAAAAPTGAPRVPGGSGSGKGEEGG